MTPQKSFIESKGCLFLALLPGLLILAAIIYFVVAMSQPQSPAERQSSTDARLIATCRSAVRAQLKDPGSAEFLNERVVNGEVVGAVRSNNSYGGKASAVFTCDRNGKVVTLG